MVFTSLAAGGAAAGAAAAGAGAAAAKAALMGALIGAATNSASTAIKGGSGSDILKAAGTGAAVGGVTGAAGSLVSGALGGASAAAQTAGETTAQTATEAAATEAATSTTANATASATGTSAATNTTASTTTATATGITNTGTKAAATEGTKTAAGAASGTPAAQLGLKPKMLGLKGKVPTPGSDGMPTVADFQGLASGAKTTSANTGPTVATTVKGKLAAAGNKVSTFTKEHPQATSNIVQGGLSLVTAGIGAGQAKAANDIATQSLAFQRNTYNEQRAKEAENKAMLKTQATQNYQSSLLFREDLMSGAPSSNLLTSYNTNGVGNEGVFSLLSTGVKTRKVTDIT